jgi:16S rRNA (guanine(966)-N(2))-methyltransferase RsmD
VLKICGGEWKGQLIKSPTGSETRPTTAFLRESVFNTLLNGLGHQPLHVLDLFAGTGALGLEALSHGAESAIFVEASPKTLKVLQQNIDKLAKAKETIVFSESDPLKWPRMLKGLLRDQNSPVPFDLAFCDPPYRKRWIPKALAALDQDFLWAEGAFFIAEMAPDEDVAHDKWQKIKEKLHGDSKVVFLQRLK